MPSLIDRIHPAYRTDRHDYRLFCAGYFAVLATIWILALLGGGHLPTPLGIACVAVEFTGAIILLLTTIRRLRDAGMSSWWAVLFFFPFQIGMDVLRLTLHLPTFSDFSLPPIPLVLIQLQPLITSIPIIIGLVKRTQPAALRTI